MNLVLTVAIGDQYQQIAKHTHPSIRAYANKVGAKFACIDKPMIAKTTPHWEKFGLFDMFDKYERILYLDTDLIVRDDCPNLFDVVPDDCIGMFDEAPYTDRSKELLIDICKSYGVTLRSWNGRYYNSGVIVSSRQHKHLFRKPEVEVFNFYEQSYLNMVIAKETPPMQQLDYRFNRMTCMDRAIGIDRHDSWVIHYAGFPNLPTVLDLIDKDINKWRSANGKYNYHHHIYVNVTGGLGDQVSVEPVVRYFRTKQYANAEMIIMSHWPRIFSHMKRLGVSVYQHGEARLNGDTPYFVANTLPGPDTINWAMLSHLLCHPVDYAAIAMMKMTLPVRDKQIQLDIDERDLDSIARYINVSDLEEAYVVHPGRHWTTKTFPTEYWQGIINGLVAAGKRVVIIGKTQPGDPPTYKPGARGTVDVVCSHEMTHDLRDLLTFGELIALLSKAKMLISNDSAPIHIAGAFDNWITLLPSCKHPDHVLPWRNGSQQYKTRSFYKRLILDDIDSRPTQTEEQSADIPVEDWSQYLIEPTSVVEQILGVE